MLPVFSRPGLAAPLRAIGAWSQVLKRVFAWVALLAMALAVWQSWGFLATTMPRVAVGNVVAAVLLWSATHLVAPRCAMLVLGRSRSINYSSALEIHALRLPAKYLPGGIWHTLARVTDFGVLGHARQSLVEFVLLENMVAAAFTLGLGAALLVMSGHTRWCGLMEVVAVLGFVSLALTPWLVKLLTHAERQFPLDRYLKLLAMTALFWASASAAFVVFLFGFGGAVMQANLTSVLGAYLFSWGAGFVAFFAPQGVGVFEFVAGTLLDGRISLTEAVALIACFRIVVLAGDLSAWAVAMLVFRRLALR